MSTWGTEQVGGSAIRIPGRETKAVKEDGRMSFRLRPLTLPLPPWCSIHPVNLNAHLGAPRHGGGVGNDQNCAHI